MPMGGSGVQQSRSNRMCNEYFSFLVRLLLISPLARARSPMISTHLVKY